MSAGGVALGAPRQARPRTPAFMQMGLAIALAVMLAAVTLTVRQPPPPAIAEFAPQAAEQIKEQPKEQASQFGSGAGDGDCPPGAPCDAGNGEGGGARDGGSTTTTAAPATDGSVPPKYGPATLKRCVGDPPRQIEDPQSPPCIAFWDDSKGNGGATSPGVTKDEIILAAPNPTPVVYEAWQKFFNDRFQLYGRKVRIVDTTGSGTGVARARAAKEKGAFASLPQYNDAPYYRELARLGIVGVYRSNDFTDTELAEHAPYLWGYTMSFTQVMTNLGDWACRRLVSQKAVHAGKVDAEKLSESDRSFGLLLEQGSVDSTLNLDQLKAALEQCGAKVPFASVYKRESNAVRDRQAVASMKAAKVTTVLCLCENPNYSSIGQFATASSYEPEWLFTSYPQQTMGAAHDNPQMSRAFGVLFEPMFRVRSDHPLVWAAQEGGADEVNSTTAVGSNDTHYRGWLALMSGLQMAGPNLTPETFRAGLQKTKFPNPDHPIMAGKVGFEGDFSMTNDGVEMWWSETDTGPNGEDEGAFCFVDGGRRYRRGTWPKGGDPFFKGPCDSGSKPVA